jgi:hypothetical protein
LEAENPICIDRIAEQERRTPGNVIRLLLKTLKAREA